MGLNSDGNGDMIDAPVKIDSSSVSRGSSGVDPQEILPPDRCSYLPNQTRHLQASVPAGGQVAVPRHVLSPSGGGGGRGYGKKIVRAAPTPMLFSPTQPPFLPPASSPPAPPPPVSP